MLTADSEQAWLRRPSAPSLIRGAVWVLLLVGFVVAGSRGLETRRIQYEAVQRPPGPAGSADKYLSQFNLSSNVLDQALAAVPSSEPIVFARLRDDRMFQEFSILSYASWPHRLYGIGCDDQGHATYTDFAPPVDAVSIAIVDAEHAPSAGSGDQVQQLAPSVWLVHAAAARPWATYCPS